MSPKVADKRMDYKLNHTQSMFEHTRFTAVALLNF